MKEFREEQVKIEGEYLIDATITYPTNAKNAPAYIIVQGTGKGNKDGDFKGLEVSLYRKLAYEIADNGALVVRYNKRGLHGSKGDFYAAGVTDLINDIIQVIQYTQGLHEVDDQRVALLGHSEGCILSVEAHKKYPVSQLILIAGAGGTLKHAMNQQQKRVLEEIKNKKGLLGVVMRRLVNIKKVQNKQQKLYKKISDSKTDTIRIQGQKMNAKWLREHFEISSTQVLADLSQLDVPTLIICGDKDVQADPSDLIIIDQLRNPMITTQLIENMDHLLHYFDGECTILNVNKQYKAHVNQPLHQGLIQILKTWIQTDR
jgi:uncharacterized protein